MGWKTIRLELARTPAYPGGSAGRAYLIRLPLDDSGLVDDAALSASPSEATVRRFWPSEADRDGLIERSGNGLAMRFNGRGRDPALALLEPGPLLLGAEVTITEPDGSRLPFRVASVRKLA